MRVSELPALHSAVPALPAAGSGTRTLDGAFTQALRQAQAEIDTLVRDGWPTAMAPALDAEGLVRRMATLRQAADAPPPLAAAQSVPAGRSARAMPLAASTLAAAARNPEQHDFLASIAPWAQRAGAALGVAPELVAAHAALESGWGQHPLRAADGSDSHNLFGIKAQGGWRGARVQAMTTEVEDGLAQPRSESFRAYPDIASAFDDYAQLLQGNTRYQDALNVGRDAGAFAQALARGGYATDPDYAAKLTRLATQLQARPARPAR